MIDRHSLKISYSSLKQEIKDCISRVNSAYDYAIMTVDDMQFVGEGTTTVDFSEPLGGAVGITMPQPVQDDDYVSDYTYVAGIVSVYHETQHIKQQIHPEDANIVKSFIVANYEPQYDPPTANYWNMPHEINAEYEGIINAHEYLTVKLGQEKADAAILNYVNDRAHGNYFVHKHVWQKFKSLDEVTDAFDDAYEHAVEHLKSYDFSIDGAIKRSGIDKRTLKQYLNIRNKEEQLSRLVAVEDYLHPGLISEGVNDEKIRQELRKDCFNYNPADLPKQTRYQMNESRINPLRQRLYKQQRSSLPREIPEIGSTEYEGQEKEI